MIFDHKVHSSKLKLKNLTQKPLSQQEVGALWTKLAAVQK